MCLTLKPGTPAPVSWDLPQNMRHVDPEGQSHVGSICTFIFLGNRKMYIIVINEILSQKKIKY